MSKIVLATTQQPTAAADFTAILRGKQFFAELR